MELLGDVGHVESRFCPFGDGVSVGAGLVHGLRQSTISSETVLDAPMVLLGDEAQVQARFGLFRDSTSLMQDRCTVYAEQTIGSENCFGRT